MIFWLYEIDFLGKLCVFSIMSFCACCVVLFLSVMGLIQEEDGLWNFVKNKLWIPLIPGLLLMAIPSEKTMYLMLSTRVMRDVVTDGRVYRCGQRYQDTAIGEKSLKLLEQKLDDMLKEK